MVGEYLVVNELVCPGIENLEFRRKISIPAGMMDESDSLRTSTSAEVATTVASGKTLRRPLDLAH